MDTTLSESRVWANGLWFHCASQGEGPLVLLLHGFPERWFSWRHQLPALASLGYRVVAPDLRGYGQTDRPRRGYALPDLARDIAELIPALGADRATVIGHDWGGAITWETVSRHPARVERFAVLNCPHPAVMTRALLRSRAQLKKSWYMFFFNLPLLPEWLLTRNQGAAIEGMFSGNAFDRSHLTEEDLRPFRESVVQPGAATAMLAYYRQAIRGSLALPRTLLARADEYPLIEHPGLLLWAEDDAALGLELVAPHVDLCRDLHVRRVPRCGHFLQQEQPEIVNDLLSEWLGPASPG